jgi:hypothetical protein
MHGDPGAELTGVFLVPRKFSDVLEQRLRLAPSSLRRRGC